MQATCKHAGTKAGRRLDRSTTWRGSNRRLSSRQRQPSKTDEGAVQKDLLEAEARRRSGAPEGEPILALDGCNDCLESSADSANEDVKQGRDKLEHDVLLISGRCRTRGLIGAPLTLAINFSRAYIRKTTDPLCGGTPRLTPGIRARPAAPPLGAPISCRERACR